MNKHCLFLFCLFSSIQIFAQNNIPSYVPTNGLVAWYAFNGNANDESGNGNNGTVYGASLTSDRFGNAGKAYSFDGYSKIQTLTAGPTGNGISLSFWYKTSKINMMQTISYGSMNWGSYFGAYLNHYAAQTIGPCYGPSFTNAGTLVNKNTGSIQDSTIWHHAVIIIPNGAVDLNSLIFYLDGQLLTGSCSFANYGAPSPNIDNGNPILIGAGWYSGIPYNDFNGKLDDIGFWNRALSQQEVTSLYQVQTTNNTNTDTTITKPVPPGIPYQAVIRNASGQIMTNANVTAQFTLHKDSALGVVEYQEVHLLTTNAQGLINTVLGKGTATQGTFTSINWANTNKFLQVQMDMGNGYVDLGTQQLMSVPYAMYAANGPKGEKGDKGDSGVAGPQGLQGVQGPPGNGFQNGTVNGQMLYWKDSVWVTVSPGANGQTLTLCNGLPHWGPCPVDTILPTQIAIGSQIWDNKNLDVSTYRNGDPIPQVTDTIQWANLTTGAWCWYNNDSANYWQYGKLYNWYAVNDPRGLAPIGWHVPTDGEWNKLVKFLEPSADTTLSGWQNTTVGGMLKSTTLWNSPNTGATNTSGFGALPGGRRFSSGYFSNVGNFGYWWTSTENNASFAWYRYLSSTSIDIHRFNFNKVVGFSVRLIKD